MTYRELVAKMNATFNDEQWDSDVTILDEQDECYPAELRIAEDNGILDENHPVIAFRSP